jgi:predicted nucleic acid-binding protein
LDLGESEAIARSMELQFDVLIIEVGVLLEAKKKGHIASVRPYLDKLRVTGFRLGEEVYQLALKLSHESKAK